MKRTTATLFACSTFAIAATAHARGLQARTEVTPADGYEAVPAVLFVPDAPISLIPSSMCPISQGGNDNAGLGCVAGLDAATDYMPPANLVNVVEGLSSALAPYNVLVTSVRPPEYVPYQMLLPSDEVNAESLSRTCAGAAIDCDGVQRNDIAFTSGGSMFCMDPDPVQAALIAFGYMSGLENNDNPMDPMFYQADAPFGPDFTMPALTYADTCSNLVQTVDDMEMINPLQCAASINHEPYCDGMDNQANSHQELLAYYGPGPVVEDTTPPTVEALGIMDMDGAVIPDGGALPLTATVSDDSGPVFVRWTLTSDNADFLTFDADGNGSVCKSHNGVCEVDFMGEVPYQQIEGNNYDATEIAMVPGDDYTITFEASDLYGNTIEAVTVTITVEGGGGGESGGADTSGGGSASASDTNASASASDSNGDESTSSDIEGPGDSGQTDDSGGGCSCNSPGAGGSAWFLLGFVGLAAGRRRSRR
ncbi:MAG: hypothetical protein K1X88_04180 [Nannocystaceae bacterium]|nr:hypothetical protein [Nannocystaceae bacterium]